MYIHKRSSKVKKTYDKSMEFRVEEIKKSLWVKGAKLKLVKEILIRVLGF